MESHLYSWIRRINIVKMALSSGSTYNNAIPIRIPSGYFAEIGNLILKFMWKGKGIQKSENNLEKCKVGGLILPNFKMYYKAAVVKSV